MVGCLDMLFSMMFLNLLLNFSYSSQEIPPRNCYDSMRPSVYREGDLVLGGFFPLYFMEPESDMILLSFLSRPKDKMEIDW